MHLKVPQDAGDLLGTSKYLVAMDQSASLVFFGSEQARDNDAPCRELSHRSQVQLGNYIDADDENILRPLQGRCRRQCRFPASGMAQADKLARTHQAKNDQTCLD